MLTTFIVGAVVVAIGLRPTPSMAQNARPEPEEDWHVEMGRLIDEVDARLAEAEPIRLRYEYHTSAIHRAKMVFESAKKTHEVAIIAVEEFSKGIYPQKLEGAEGDIAAAEAFRTNPARSSGSSSRLSRRTRVMRTSCVFN